MAEPDELSQRLAYVLKNHSQAEIARRTGTSTPSVNRYLKGTRVPLDFGVALVRELGVNPAWLLTGKGAPYASEIAPSNEQLAGSLLELVEALNTVARMRLGAISREEPARVLRELSDALERYEDVRKRLLTYSEPVISKLIVELSGALRKRELAQARGVLAAADQVVPFVANPDTLMILDTLRAEYAFRSGRREEALQLQEALVHRWLLSSNRQHEVAYIQVLNYATVLIDRRRLHEARRLLRAALAWGEEIGPRWRAIALLRSMLGNTQVEMGSLEEGLLMMHQGLALLRICEPACFETDIHGYHAHILRAQVLTGATSLTEALKRDTPAAFMAGLVRLACWREDVQLMKLSQSKMKGADLGGDSYYALMSIALPMLIAAGNGKSPTAREFDSAMAGLIESEPSSPMRFAMLVLHAQISRIAGKDSACGKFTAEAGGLLAELEPRHTMQLEFRAIHAKNRILSGDEGGGQFFRDMADKGFRSFGAPA